MNLNSEASGEVSLVSLIVFERGEVNAVNVDFDTIAAAANEVFIPVLGFGKTRERLR